MNENFDHDVIDETSPFKNMNENLKKRDSSQFLLLENIFLNLLKMILQQIICISK